MSLLLGRQVKELRQDVLSLKAEVSTLQKMLALVGGRAEFDPSELFKRMTALEEKAQKQTMQYVALNARLSKKEKG